mmetsp:Transcript_14190/g.29806  ORF Transcript_14190/g.29806 Transcript_14190/m.29806 type:complete len:261 (+) Transcript_14190:383-1165(+)
MLRFILGAFLGDPRPLLLCVGREALLFAAGLLAEALLVLLVLLVELFLVAFCLLGALRFRLLTLRQSLGGEALAVAALGTGLFEAALPLAVLLRQARCLLGLLFGPPLRCFPALLLNRRVQGLGVFALHRRPLLWRQGLLSSKLPGGVLDKVGELRQREHTILVFVRMSHALGEHLRHESGVQLLGVLGQLELVQHADKLLVVDGTRLVLVKPGEDSLHLAGRGLLPAPDAGTDPHLRASSRRCCNTDRRKRKDAGSKRA